MTMKSATRHLLAALLLPLLFSGCVGKPGPVNIYTLSTIKPEPETSGPVFPWNAVVMPVKLAPHLDQDGPIFRNHAAQAAPSPVHLWVAPLDQQLTQVISADLSHAMNTTAVAAYPGPRYAKYRYQIEIEIQEFTVLDNTFALQAVWTVSDVEARLIINRSSFYATRPVAQGDYLAYAETGSALAGELSREIGHYLFTRSEN